MNKFEKLAEKNGLSVKTIKPKDKLESIAQTLEMIEEAIVELAEIMVGDDNG